MQYEVWWLFWVKTKYLGSTYAIHRKVHIHAGGFCSSNR